jgi:2'-5' RNA ligase
VASGGGALTESVWFVGAPVAFAPDDESLVPADAALRATRPGDRHLTLLFLGRVSEDTALRLWRALPPLRLPGEVRALGWERFGRTALALELDDDGMLEAAARVCNEHAAGVVEVEARERYRPHVTMARVPRRGRPPSPASLHAWRLPAAPLTAGPPTLFRSRSGPGADRYEVVDQQD